MLLQTCNEIRRLPKKTFERKPNFYSREKITEGYEHRRGDNEHKHVSWGKKEGRESTSRLDTQTSALASNRQEHHPL